MWLRNYVDLDQRFLLEMVGSMYIYEAKLIWEPEILTDKEMFDYYFAYMGYFQ